MGQFDKTEMAEIYLYVLGLFGTKKNGSNSKILKQIKIVVAFS